MSPAADARPSGETIRLSRPRSNFLNFVRWTSAVIVLIAHVERTRQILTGSTGQGHRAGFYGYCTSHAHVAVMFFFVLSGYLVGYAAHKRPEHKRSIREYLLDRWSRIYAVLPSAVLLTLVLDAVGGRFSANYHSALLPADRLGVRLAANLFSFQGTFGHRIQLGSNPALWSIGYEVWYYAAFGLLFFASSIFRRRAALVVAVVILAAIAGPKMVLYSTIWALGYATFRLYHLHCVRIHRRWFLPLVGVTLLTNHFLEYEQVFALPEFVADACVAVATSLVLLCDIDELPSPLVRANTYLADFSYSVYAYHMPIAFFCFSVIPVRKTLSLPPVVMGLAVSALCLIIARLLFHAFESRRPALRARVAALITRRAGGPSAPTAVTDSGSR